MEWDRFFAASSLAVALVAQGPTTPIAPGADDVFKPYLDGKAPEILRELAVTNEVPGNVTLRPVVFRSRDQSEIFAVIATPKAPGPHPGMLVLHGGGGCAEREKAVAWAQRGYVAVAPDLPGIAEPKKILDSLGRWSNMKYGEGRYTANPDAGASILVDAVLAAMKSFYLLRAQAAVDPARLGVVGISWGGYMTTMVCGLAGGQVRAGFSVFGCGFYELTSQKPALMKLPQPERERWLAQLDAGRRAPGIRAPFFIAASANDFFFWPPGVQATLDAIPGEHNHLYSPNETHRVSLPGGTVFPNQPTEPFVATSFQPYPTPSGSKANWLAMETPFFEYHLKGIGKPLPSLSLEAAPNPLVARVTYTGPRDAAKVEVHWSTNTGDNWTKRKWLPLGTASLGAGRFEATLPSEAASGSAWFAVASDDRPVTVSSPLVQIKAPSMGNP